MFTAELKDWQYWLFIKFINGFKAEVNGTEYVNEQLVIEYLAKIHRTLKDNFTVLFSKSAKGYKKVNTTYVEYDKDTQLYYGAVTVRVRFFTQ